MADGHITVELSTQAAQAELARLRAENAALKRDLGDDNDWLGWYCWENDMGAKGLEVTSTSGKTIKVKTVAHLARVICY